ncbi:MAG: tetratricopeptide repeat protein [Planctomycetota bacterium]|jgi:tetratricopeptide (TPR) repeat protein
MADAQMESPAGKGKVFFDRADQVAETGNWDFAIELYLEGIQREPGNIQRGHQPLREVALKRKVQGGKSAGMIEALKRRGGKDPAENLANAEYLLAKEPGSVSHMVQTLKAARVLGEGGLIKWVSNILLEAQRQGKQNKNVLLLLADAFQDIEEYASAIAACEMAQQLAPKDQTLPDRLNELSAKYTIKKGGYDQEGSFAKGIKDLEKQKELMQKDALVKGGDFLRNQIDVARKDYEQSQTVPGKINALVDALLKTQDDGDENEAVGVLTKAHKDIGAYQFKMRIGDIRMRQMARQYRKLAESGDKAAALEEAKKQLAFELQEYTERAENYPTDLAIKFELGKRQYLSGKYDEAIGSLQQAQRDPRRHIPALNYLGQAFAKKGWLQEASETYERALETEMPEVRKKEILYHLGDVYEKMDQLDKAQDMFSDLAQLDYNYRDTRNRLDQVRKKLGASGEK